MAESPKTIEDFLENVPPGRRVLLDKSSILISVSEQNSLFPHRGRFLHLASPPELTLHCGEPSCDRLQLFSPDDDNSSLVTADKFLQFTCRNCGKTQKTYAVRFFTDGIDREKVEAQKFGELPTFGPPLPAKLLQLAGEHGDLLKKGRQSENQSLGIGAFAYYRRVVELQKARLIDELKNAIQRLGGDEEALKALEAARDETQFAKALELMAAVTPMELFVSGQNPLRLLHRPLSEGIHGMSDEECLDKAHSVRVVMGALLERVQIVTEQKAELDAAIKDLTSREK